MNIFDKGVKYGYRSNDINASPIYIYIYIYIYINGNLMLRKIENMLEKKTFTDVFIYI